MFQTLLAKSLSLEEQNCARARGAAKYTGHISCVMQAADVLVDELGLCILQQLGLADTIKFEHFASTVRLGAYLHDWGKANQHFQSMIYLKTLDPKSSDSNQVEYRRTIQQASRKHSDRQMLRHEVISGILALYVPTVRRWLMQCPDANLVVAVWAAMGHHLKIGIGQNRQPSGEIAFISDGTGSELAIYTQHRDFKTILEMGKKSLRLPETLPNFPPETWSKQELLSALTVLRDKFNKLESSLDWNQKKFAAAVKATVIAADLAGSALPQAHDDFRAWMKEILNLTLMSEDLEKLVHQRLDGQPLRPFQQKIAASKRRVTWVKAGCGTGKTVGAYKWSEENAKGRRLFFCYPTTGTASQGFIDYVIGTEIEAELMHSRADLDRDLLFSGESDDLDADAEGIDSRLTAFQAWRKKLVVCTVDTVLGLIQNNRKPLYAWPAIANAAFVFDEVHAYDQRLFGALLKFLKTFRGAPILLMSASFTPEQMQKIREVMTELGEEIDEPIEGPKELEELPRYEIRWIQEVNQPEDAPELWQPVKDALERGDKVLWVTNSVPSCVSLYRSAKAQLAEQLPFAQPLIYHSRYRYYDRLKKHDAVIKAFGRKGAVLAITTQVCEMSLDLSADLLVSALAPASSLIQRLGRLNRRMKHKEEGTKLALIYPWIAQHPYRPEELSTGEELIQQIIGKTSVSQADLAAIAANLNSRAEEEVRSRWLDDNWCAYSDALRDGGGTVTVLLQEDLGAIAKAAALRQDKGFMREAQGWTVPIRIPKNLREWKRCRFYPIAPPEELFYSKETGAEPCNS